MDIIRNKGTRIANYAIDGAGSDIVEGAVVMRGATPTANPGCAVVASGAAADSIGLMASLHDFSVVGDTTPEDGAAYVKNGVYRFEPGCEVAAEYDEATLLDVASATTTVVTITSLQDNIDGAWIYVSDDGNTGAGQLGYFTASASGSATLKSALTTTLDNTSNVIVIRPTFYAAHTLNTAADKIITSAADGSLPWVALRNEFKYHGQEGWIELDPTKHHNLQLTGLSPIFRTVFSPRDTIMNPGS